ncbi:MAG: tetratricopeptide repeat protein [Deltaproteobacteria bacterium]|nr:tetratricopeptide repeat protein [Deltaproteobacteria bacterium]
MGSVGARREDNRVALLFYLSVAFHIWMIVDAIRRRVEPFWYVILLFPAGALIYFFIVKLRISELVNIAPKQTVATQPVTEYDFTDIDGFKKEVEQSPSFANRLRLAKAFFAGKRFEEAAHYFALALKTHPREREALYGLGLCRLELKQTAGAIDTLTELVDRNLEYDDYKAAQILAQTLWNEGRREETFLLLEEIKERSPELRHRIVIAHYLVKEGLRQRAIEVLEEALTRFNRASEYVRKREGRWATEARGLLRNLKHGA